MATELLQFVDAFLGTPVTDIDYIIYMLVAGCLMVLVVVSVVDVFKLFVSLITGEGR